MLLNSYHLVAPVCEGVGGCRHLGWLLVTIRVLLEVAWCFLSDANVYPEPDRLASISVIIIILKKFEFGKETFRRCRRRKEAALELDLLWWQCVALINFISDFVHNHQGKIVKKLDKQVKYWYPWLT